MKKALDIGNDEELDFIRDHWDLVDYGLESENQAVREAASKLL